MKLNIIFKSVFLLLLIMSIQLSFAQQKDPLEGIDVTKILMHLDWYRMNYFDAKNKEVVVENNKNKEFWNFLFPIRYFYSRRSLALSRRITRIV